MFINNELDQIMNKLAEIQEGKESTEDLSKYSYKEPQNIRQDVNDLNRVVNRIDRRIEKSGIIPDSFCSKPVEEVETIRERSFKKTLNATLQLKARYQNLAVAMG
jgi:septation ring formation regulator EzrA